MLKRMIVEDVVVNGTTFKISPLPAFFSAKVFGDLVSTVFPIIGAASLASGVSSLDLSSGNLEEAAASLDEDSIVSALGKINGDVLVRIISELLLDYQNVRIMDGVEWRAMTREDFDEIFCMSVFGVFELSAAVIAQNYRSFFGDVDALFGRLKKERLDKAKKVTSPGTETSTARS